MSRSRSRRGNILVIVSVLALVVFAALFSLSYLTRTDVVSSSNLLREITATSIAESIAAQIEARTNTHPWPDRFWLPDSGPPERRIDGATPEIDLSRESFPSADYEFVGIVKDLPTELREYRIYLEVKVKGETYAFSWDKRWEMSMLAAMNRDMTQVGKSYDDVPANLNATDTLINTIKEAADTAPPADSSLTQSAPLAAKVARLRKDEKTFKGRAFPGAPANRPGFSADGRAATGTFTNGFGTPPPSAPPVRDTGNPNRGGNQR